MMMMMMMMMMMKKKKTFQSVLNGFDHDVKKKIDGAFC